MAKRTYKEKRKVETIEREIIDDYDDVRLPKKHRFNNGNFITLFQETIANIALNADLKKGEYKLLLYLIGTAGLDNSVCVDLNILSKTLKTDKGNVSRDLGELVKRNIILRKDGYRYGNQPLPFELSLNYDQINYDLAYNGKVKDFSKVHFKHPEIELSPKELPTSQTSLLDQIHHDKKVDIMEKNKDTSFED